MSTDTQSDESKALATLAAADMIAGPDDEERDYEFDKLLTGRPEPVRFEEPGAFVHGTVVDKLVQQKRDFDTGDPKYNDDGSPALEPLVILKTEDGLLTLYLSSWRLAKEVGLAVRAAGQRRMQRGGSLAVRFTGYGEPYKKGAQPPKEYEAAYDPPGVTPGAALSAEVNAAELGPPPVRSFASEVSTECIDGDCKGCDSRRCTHDCHRASKPPAEMTTDDGPPPF